MGGRAGDALVRSAMACVSHAETHAILGNARYFPNRASRRGGGDNPTIPDVHVGVVIVLLVAVAVARVVAAWALAHDVLNLKNREVGDRKVFWRAGRQQACQRAK